MIGANGEESKITPWEEAQKEKRAIEEAQVKRLLIRGWALEKDGWWSHTKYQHQGLPMLFMFEQACKAEQI